MLNKQDIIGYIQSKKDYINNKYEKIGNSPSTDNQIVDEISDLLLKVEKEEYNEKTRELDNFVRSRQGEIDEIYKNQNEEIRLLKGDYYESISDEISKMVEHIEREKENLGDTSLKFKGVSTSINDIEGFLEKNNTNIEYLINNLNDINIDFRKALDVYTKQINENIGDKSKELINALEKEKENAEKKLNADIITANLEILKEKEEKIKKIKKSIGVDIYHGSLEKIERRIELNNKGLLEIDLVNIIKYTFFLGVTISLVYIDYLLANQIVTDSYKNTILDLEYKEIQEGKREIYLIVIKYIMPAIFSGGLIFMEYVVKYFNGIKKKILHIFTLALMFAIVFILPLNIKDLINLDTKAFSRIQPMDIIIRMMMFFGVILAWGHILRRFTKESELIDFIKDTLFYPIRLLMLPFIYLIYFLDIWLLKYKKRVFLSDINVLEESVRNISIKPIGIDSDYSDFGVLDTTNIEKKYGSIQIISSFIKNTDDMFYKMSSISNQLDNLYQNFGKNEALLGNKINNLKNKIGEFNSMLKEEKERIEEQYIGNIEQINSQIEEFINEGSEFKHQYDDYESFVKKSILEGLTLFKNN